MKREASGIWDGVYVFSVGIERSLSLLFHNSLLRDD